MDAFDRRLIADRLSRILVEEDRSDEQVQEIVFHMTDWLEDALAWTEFINTPSKLSDEALSKLLYSFLVHVPAHVVAARRLVLGLPVEDVFGIGATLGTGEPEPTR